MRVWLFDIDGTLLVTGGAGQDAAVLALQDAFQIPASREGVSFAGRTDRAINRDLFEKHGIESSAANWGRFQDAYLKRLEQLLDQRAGEVLPGVLDLIDRLETMPNTHVGLITGNVRAAAELKLRRYGIWDRFAFGGYGDEHADRADVAWAARAAAEQHVAADVDPSCIWIIGDTGNDVYCARAIGARVIAVATGQSDMNTLGLTEPDLLLRDLRDVFNHPHVFAI